MADIEDDYTAEAVGGSHVPPAFDSQDGTAEIPHPKRHVFVMPSGDMLADRLEESLLTTIKHPRHGAPQLVFVNPAGNMLEVQEHHRRFGQTWFIGDYVEPKSPLYVVTPMDIMFIALYVLRGCVSGSVGAVEATVQCSPTTSRFLDAISLLGKCPQIAILTPMCHRRIEDAFLSIADVTDGNGSPIATNEDAKARLARGRAAHDGGVLVAPEDRLHYRYNADKCVQWLARKYAVLLGAMQEAAASRVAISAADSCSAASPTRSACDGAGPAADADATCSAEAASPTKSPTTTLQLQSAGMGASIATDVSLGLPSHLLAEKAAQFIAEYLDRGLEPAVLKATGVDLAALRSEALNLRKSNNSAAAMSRGAAGIEAMGLDDISGEPADKKKRVEVKSASVKKLEKAGAPKGTPTLFSMFKKAPPPASAATNPPPPPATPQ